MGNYGIFVRKIAVGIFGCSSCSRIVRLCRHCF